MKRSKKIEAYNALESLKKGCMQGSMKYEVINSEICPSDNTTEFAVMTTKEKFSSTDYKELNGELQIAILSVRNGI